MKNSKQIPQLSNMMLTEIAVKEVPQIDRELKNQLMKQLSPDDLSKIKRGFNLYNGVVTVQQFIALMVDALYNQYTAKNHYKQTLTFIELFLLIDINSRGKIKFEDFTNFLIDRRSKEEKGQELQFFPAKNLSHVDLAAEIVFPLNNCPFLGMSSNNRKSVDLVDTKNYKIQQSLSFGGVLVNNIVYLPKYDIFCISTNDKFLNFYQSFENLLVKRFSLPDSIFFLMNYQDKLFAGATQGNIYELSLKKIFQNIKKKNQQNSILKFLAKETESESESEKKKYQPNQQYKLYISNKVIKEQPDLTCIDFMESLELVITGSNDCRVRLYQMREHGLHLMKQLNGHYKGIKGVTVSRHHKVIISCSFDFDLLVWNAYLEHPVARLEGHEAPLYTVYCPKQHQIIISSDYKGIMKIWNSETYVLMQNLTINVPQNNPQSSNSQNMSFNFVYKQQCDLAILYKRKLLFYQFTVSYNPKLTDNQDLGAIRYSKKNLQLYIGSKKSIKVWSVSKGLLTKVYRDVIDANISLMELDSRQRRIFVGSLEGHILSIDIFSGLVISKYSKHQMEISLLIYDNVNELLLTGGWDKIVKIHNDTQHLQKIQSRENVLRNIKNIHEKQLANGSFSESQLLIATHCRTKIVRIWDFEKGFLQGQIMVPNDINLVHFVNPLPVIIITDIKGGIYIFTTKYAQKPYKFLASWKNMYSIQKTSLITYISSVYQQKKVNEKKNSQQGQFTCQIILGDQFGYLRVIDITQFLHEEKIKPIQKQSIGNKNAFRIQDYINTGNSKTSDNTHDFSNKQTKNIAPPGYLKQKMQVKAHNDRITYVCLVEESKDRMFLSAGSDRLVRLWSENGEPRGVMRQGNKQKNTSWQYKINQDWKTREVKNFEQIQISLQKTFIDYMGRKRQSVVPFTSEEKFQQVDNKQIYQSLKQIDTYLEKYSKKIQKRLY